MTNSNNSAQTAKPKSRRIWLQVAVIVVVLAVVAVVVGVVLNNNHPAAAKAAPATSTTAGPKNMRSDGILITGSKGDLVSTRTAAVPQHGLPVPTDQSKLKSTANIVEYIDYQCPACLAFEETNLNNVASWVGNGKATLELHPIAFLDRSSMGTRYSSRADNAAACVANFAPDRYVFAAAALYSNQPSEGTTGLTNKQINAVLTKAKSSNADIVNCVNQETFKSWVTAATARVMNGTFSGVALKPSSFQGTPTVFVDGVQYTGSITDAAAFTAFVEKQKPGTTD